MNEVHLTISQETILPSTDHLVHVENNYITYGTKFLQVLKASITSNVTVE